MMEFDGLKRKTVHLCRVNGKADLSRPVLVRNVMDMLEGREELGNLDFCECQEVCDKATRSELVQILAELLTAEQIIAIRDREEYVTDDDGDDLLILN